LLEVLGHYFSIGLVCEFHHVSSKGCHHHPKGTAILEMVFHDFQGSIFPCMMLKKNAPNHGKPAVNEQDV